MDNKFSIMENNIMTEYEIIKLCKRDNINYIIYKDNDNYYSSRYNIKNNKIELSLIENDDEWDFIDKCLGDINE